MESVLEIEDKNHLIIELIETAQKLNDLAIRISKHIDQVTCLSQKTPSESVT